MYNFSQEQIFIFFFIIGIIIGIIFDIFRVIRKSFKTPDTITFIEDLIFLILTSILIIFSIIKLNGGEVRFYLFRVCYKGITHCRIEFRRPVAAHIRCDTGQESIASTVGPIKGIES